MIRGVAGLLVALGASACVNDPSVDYANDPSTIVLDPETMFITHGTEKQVFARLVDERNRATPTEFTISNVSAGLTVRVDSTYRLDYINGDSLSWRPVQHQHRLWVGSSNPQGAMGQFTVTAQGISTTATARILPADLGSGLSSTSPGIGDVVTLTAPANVSFTDNATVAVVDGNTVVNAVVMDRAPKSISFVPFPGSTGVVRVAGVTLDYAPTLASRTLPTAATITVPEDPSSPSLSTTAPALGAPVTITAGPGQQFSSNSAVSFDPGGAAVVTARTATTLTILPRPGSGGAATVTNVVLTDGEAEVLGTFTRTTSNGFTTPVPAATSIPVAYSSTSPAPSAPVTVTATGFKFLPNVSFTFGGTAALVLNVSADSNTVTILPPPNVAGETAVVSNAVLEFLPIVPITGLTTTPVVTTGDYAAAGPGGDMFSNAPVINAPAEGTTAFHAESGTLAFGAEINPLGGSNQGIPRYYKLIVTEAREYDIAIGWEVGGDFDLYVFDEAGATNLAQSPSGANPESVSVELEPGTYRLILHNWRSLAATPVRVLVTVK